MLLSDDFFLSENTGGQATQSTVSNSIRKLDLNSRETVFMHIYNTRRIFNGKFMNLIYTKDQNVSRKVEKG